MSPRVSAQLAAIAESDPLPPQSDLLARPIDLDGVYRSERPKLLRYLSRWTCSERAEDIIHMVFARLAARGGGDPIENVGAYLRQASSHAIIDQHRSECRFSPLVEADFNCQASAAADPVAGLEARDRLARLDRALRGMKPLTRQIFLARRLDGYSYAEISERTGLSVAAVEKQISRAIKQLGRHLDPHA